MMMNLLLSASSPDGSLVAVAAPSSSSSSATGNNHRHLIQVYQTLMMAAGSSSTSSTSLQLTLAHTTTTKRRGGLQQLIMVGQSQLLGLFGSRQVVVWDLERGVVAHTHTLKNGDDDDEDEDEDDHDDGKAFLAVAAAAASTTANRDDELESNNFGHYYILTRLGRKLLVHEYHVSNHKLSRKIKCGKWNSDDVNDDGDAVMANGNNSSSPLTSPVKASLVVTPTRVVVRTREHGVRIMDKESGQKVGKIKPNSKKDSSSSSVDVIPLDMTLCANDVQVLALLQGSGAVALYDLESTKELARVPPAEGLSLAPHAYKLQVIKEDEGSSFSVLCDHVLSKVTEKKMRHETRTTFSSEDPTTLLLRGKTMVDQPEDQVLALMYHRQAAECKSQCIPLSKDFPSVFQLGQDDEVEASPEDTGTKMSLTGSASKRKHKATDPVVLGPGQVGDENAPAVKKRKQANSNFDDDIEEDEDDDENEKDANEEDGDEVKNMTIAERLQQLTEALEEEEEDEEEEEQEEDEDDDDAASKGIKANANLSFKPKKATTESVKELLTQALQSSDDGLLELALAVRDVKIISRTLRELDDALLVTLLGKLTTRLASTPLRAESLAVWISYCLKLGRYEAHHLAVLKNMLYERIESFSDLLRLEGRLSMMVDADD